MNLSTRLLSSSPLVQFGILNLKAPPARGSQSGGGAASSCLLSLDANCRALRADALTC